MKIEGLETTTNDDEFQCREKRKICFFVPSGNDAKNESEKVSFFALFYILILI